MMNLESEKCVGFPGALIIGSGPSGLAVAACLKHKGIPYLILEKESCLASLWELKTYDRLKLHLPKELCQLPYNMPFPREYPAYPTKQQFIAYLETYASHFSIRPRFSEEVQWARYDIAMSLWRVRANELVFSCRWLIVATGKNEVPVVSEVAGLGNYNGKLLHTSAYKNGDEFWGKKSVGCRIWEFCSGG